MGRHTCDMAHGHGGWDGPGWAGWGVLSQHPPLAYAYPYAPSLARLCVQAACEDIRQHPIPGEAGGSSQQQQQGGAVGSGGKGGPVDTSGVAWKWDILRDMR